ncbi:hypothetical protein DPMN_114721 [Dreissena polymorpha]|uniref:Uncharacterized protein n=1 Tax=Dreissena polymorpha TaxID=45954 RepID=A0A9D4QSS1_DREPO|nr:hypothetical protein DPMN_114721 [Dreissena polymorpha]
MLGTNPTAVYNALDKCHRTKINKHDDELAAGKSRAEYQAMRKGTAYVIIDLSFQAY